MTTAQLAILGLSLSPIILPLMGMLYKALQGAALLAKQVVFEEHGSTDFSFANAVATYLRAHGRALCAPPVTNWSEFKLFVKSRDQQMSVGAKLTLGTTRLYLYRGAPVLFLSKLLDNGSNQYRFTFIRGTINFDALVAEAMIEYSRPPDSASRHAFYHVPETDSGPGSSAAPPTAARAKDDTAVAVLSTTQVVGYDKEDIGRPVPEKPFDSYVETRVATEIREDFDFWFRRRKWHEVRGVAWQRGYLLKGPPGGGKTAFVRALAQEYDLPVYRFDLPAMSNSRLEREVAKAQLCSPCIFLFDDLDGVYQRRQKAQRRPTVYGVNGTASEIPELNSHLYGGDQPDMEQALNGDEKRGTGVSFDAFLNAIGGVKPLHGVAVFVTTNHPELLDDAVTRDGRLDFHAEFGGLEREGKIRLVKNLIEGPDGPPDPDTVMDLVNSSPDNETPAQLRGRALKRAKQLLWTQKEAA